MRLNFLRKGSHGQKGSQLGVLVITGSCCIPGMAPLDEKARLIVEQAISETSVAVQVEVVTAMRAYFGGVPKRVIGELIAMSNQGRFGLPAVLINGEVVSYGVPTLEDMKAALHKFAENAKEESKKWTNI